MMFPDVSPCIVYVYVYVCECMHAGTYVCMHAFIHVFMCLCFLWWFCWTLEEVNKENAECEVLFLSTPCMYILCMVISEVMCIGLRNVGKQIYGFLPHGENSPNFLREWCMNALFLHRPIRDDQVVCFLLTTIDEASGSSKQWSNQFLRMLIFMRKEFLFPCIPSKEVMYPLDSRSDWVFFYIHHTHTYICIYIYM